MGLKVRILSVVAAGACAVGMSVAVAPSASASIGQCGFDGKFCLWSSTLNRGGFEGLTGPTSQIRLENNARSYANQTNVTWCVWGGANFTGPVLVSAPAGASGDIPDSTPGGNYDSDASSAGPC